MASLLTEFNGTTSKSAFDAGVTAYGLKQGMTYYVKETACPDGYTAEERYFTLYMDDGILTVTVYDSDGKQIEEYTYTYDANGSTWEEGTVTAAWNYATDDNTSFTYNSAASNGGVASYDIVFTIQNTEAYELPATGSMGVFPYRRAGTVFVLVSITGLLIIAFYHLVWVRKLRTSVSNKEYTEEKGKRRRHFARTRDHPRERNGIHGRDVSFSFAHSGKERSRGTGPGTE